VAAMDERIEYLMSRCEAIAEAAVRAEVLELLGLVLELHRAGLAGMMAAAAGAGDLEGLRAAWGRDERVRGLAELHGLELPAAAAGRGGFVPLAALAGSRARRDDGADRAGTTATQAQI